MRLRLSALLTLCAATGLASGCGGDDDITGAMTYRIETASTDVSVGQDSSVDVSATVRNVTQDRVLEAAPIQYRSADYAIANVANNGRVTGLKGGTTDILAVFRDDTLRIPVTVRANPITDLQLRFVPPRTGSPATIVDAGDPRIVPVVSPDGRSVALGSGVGFDLVTSGMTTEVAILATDATGDRVRALRPAEFGVSSTVPSIQRRAIWSSTNEDVVTVSNGSSTFGRITARQPGTAQVILTFPGDDLADTLDVTVFRRPLTGVRVSVATAGAPLAILRGASLQLAAVPTVGTAVGSNTIISPSGNAVERRVIWSSADPDKGTVDALGIVTASNNSAMVGDTVVVLATSVPIAGVDTAVTGTIRLVITTTLPNP